MQVITQVYRESRDDYGATIVRLANTYRRAPTSKEKALYRVQQDETRQGYIYYRLFPVDR